jgi:hypothetical protein
MSSKNGTLVTPAGITVPQYSSSTQAGSLFNQSAAHEFPEITARYEACLFVCLFLIGCLAGWLAS